MAIAFVQKGTHNDILASTAAQSSALTSAVTAGDLIVVPAWEFNGSGTNFATSVTDTAGNTWPASASARLWTNNGNDRGVEIWVLPNAAAASANTYKVTLHYGSAIGEVEFDVVEFSGAATSSPVDTSGTAGTAVAGGAVNALTPTTSAAITNAGDLLISLVTAGTGSATSAFALPTNSGTWTQIGVDQDDSTHVGGESGYIILSGASLTTKSANWTWSASLQVNDNASAIVAILPSGAAAAFPIGQILL